MTRCTSASPPCQSVSTAYSAPSINSSTITPLAASVVIAGTHEVAISYPETFHIIKREGVKFYPGPMRVSNINSMLTEKLNEERNAFTDEEIDSAYKEIVKRIGRSSNKTQPTKIEKKEDSKGFAN
jgi:hypothetical protein